MSNLLRTSGSVSVRIDALERGGLVTREGAEHDRRTVLVTLTSRGRELLKNVVPEHLRLEDALLDALEPAERKQLVAPLRKLLRSLEEGHDRPGQLSLGIRVLTRRASGHRRRAVGLPDVPGLLVANVSPQSSADAAGIRVGDLIVRVGDTVTDTLPVLRKALARRTRSTEIAVLRGTDRVTISVS